MTCHPKSRQDMGGNHIRPSHFRELGGDARSCEGVKDCPAALNFLIQFGYNFFPSVSLPHFKSSFLNDLQKQVSLNLMSRSVSPIQYPQDPDIVNKLKRIDMVFRHVQDRGIHAMDRIGISRGCPGSKLYQDQEYCGSGAGGFLFCLGVSWGRPQA
jgi:hypothetical protein